MVIVSSSELFRRDYILARYLLVRAQLNDESHGLTTRATHLLAWSICRLCTHLFRLVASHGGTANEAAQSVSKLHAPSHIQTTAV